MYKIIFHMDEKEQIQHALGNIKGVSREIKQLKEDKHLELIANGTGVLSLIKGDKEIEETLSGMIDNGVTVTVCRNSLLKLNIKDHELIEGIKIVPTAVGEIARRQQDNYSYIKL